MLGYNFSPRFRDLADQRFWRAEMPGVATGGYGPLEALARNRMNLTKVTTHWPDMLRVAGSLVTGQVRAYDLLRMFGREGCPTPLGQAFAEYGRIAKTEHLLRVVDTVDDTYRRARARLAALWKPLKVTSKPSAVLLQPVPLQGLLAGFRVHRRFVWSTGSYSS